MKKTKSNTSRQIRTLMNQGLTHKQALAVVFKKDKK
jgi:hypothetical protein